MKTIVKKAGKLGRGVFANKNFKIGDVVEVSPVITIPKDEADEIQDTIIQLYIFGEPDGEAYIALGHGSLFNHSIEPNVKYRSDLENRTIVFKASKPIKKGQQLFINYEYDPIHWYKKYIKRKKRKS